MLHNNPDASDFDRLRTLAEAAAKAGTLPAERASFQTQFARGLGDLQSFLATAPSDRLNLAFGQPVRRADSVASTPLRRRAATSRFSRTVRPSSTPGAISCTQMP